MEFSLEGVLETLLVGALASVCLVSLLFLFFPEFLRLEASRRLFRFFMYEDVEVSVESTDPVLGDTHRLFVGLLLCAGLYGTGVIAESLSGLITSSDFSDTQFARQLRFFSDPEVRTAAFDVVGASTLQSGTATSTFQEFISDYHACRAAGLLEEKTYSPTCLAIDSRAAAFYYIAKNVVYRDDSYFKELSRLQNRIDFIRAIGQVLAIIASILALAFVVGLLTEGMNAYRKRRLTDPPTRFTRAYDNAPQFLRELLRHWARLAARRCLALSASTMVLAVAALYSWRNNEDEFDKRVFGYFLSYGEGLTSWAIPRSTFTTFALDFAEWFEPSAAEALGDGKYLLVANDKGGAQPLSVFHLTERSGLTLEKTAVIDLGGVTLGKVESLHSVKEIDGSFRVLVGTTFDRADPAFRRLVSFRLTTAWAVEQVEELAVDDPCSALGVQPGECVVEGLASRNLEDEILLGIRSIGPFGSRSPAVALVRLARSEKRWQAALLWRRTLAREFAGSGISGLEIASDGSLLLLTSIEEPDEPGRAAQVRGALWTIPQDEIQKPRDEGWIVDQTGQKKEHRTYLAGLFPHKPEGVTVLDNDDIVVVFDDDGSRKSRAHAPETFALDQNESVFTIVRPLPAAPREK